MRLSKFLSLVTFITSFSLLYVYQQSEVFRLAYVGSKRQAAFEDLLDKNSILRYNIKSSTSLVNIGDNLCGSVDLQMPQGYRLVRLAPAQGLRQEARPLKKETLFSRLFGIKRQAEAKTVNP